ncbi:hypothetical protein CH063_05557 [Colletotrichum higginsianum]|uniref:Uncharacterized protein n=1 Tax=Colletotrichum higginsianum (strain IMI 349063) TaxID=759273 RepID=H1UZE4_COLHI|nr:hypothetical protein CH063_05557 [Colletotrichum higginsianum]
MASKPEDQQPFLGFRDQLNIRNSLGNSEAEHCGPCCEPSAKVSRKSKLLRDAVVFLATSLIWAGLFFLLASNQLNNTPGNLPEAKHDGGKSPTQSDYLPASHNVTSNAKYISCGSSIAEAKRSGCRYATLLNYWVPSQCFDQEFETEYQDDDSWTAFADKALTQSIAPEDMGDQEVYYTSIRDHLNHCSMLWRKQFWTLFEDRTAFDGVIVNSFHTEHCAEFLKDIYGSNRTEPTLVRVGFSGCWVQNSRRS